MPAIAWRRTERFGIPEWFALVGLASFAAARWLPLLQSGFTCPLRGAIGLPCATCGMTRAFVALAHGDLSAAVAASPLGALLAAAAWGYAALDLARAALGLPWPELPQRAWRGAALAGMAAVALNWGWLLWRARGS